MLDCWGGGSVYLRAACCGDAQEAWMEEDPREAILRQQRTGEFTEAYKETQPTTQFHESDEEEEEEET